MRIYLLITNKCNLTCSMCIRGNNSIEDMQFEDFKKIFDEQDTSEMEIVITGGEPTLHLNFEKFVKYSSKKFKKVLIATNGTQNNYIDNIKNMKNIMFQVSLDGNRDVHNQIRGKYVFDNILETIEKFEKNEIKYCIASVVGYCNYKTIFELIPVLKKLKKMKYWRISYEMPFGNAQKNKIFPTEKWNNFVDKILEEVEFPLLIKKIFPLELYDKNMDSINQENRCLNCGSGKENIYIYPDFNVYPCTCLTDFCIGNIRVKNLEEIIKGKENNIFLNYNILEESICNKCKYKKLCNGGCIGMSYNILGKLGLGDIRCPILKKYYEEKSILF